MFKSSSRISDIADDAQATLIERDASFEGKLTFDGIVQIYGNFHGEIFSSGTLVIGETAVVEGKIEVGVLQISGKVKGEIVVRDRLELLSKAQVLGDICTQSLIVEHGAKFQGQCQMGVVPESAESHRQNGLYAPRLSSDDRPLHADRHASLSPVMNPLEEIELFQ